MLNDSKTIQQIIAQSTTKGLLSFALQSLLNHTVAEKVYLVRPGGVSWRIAAEQQAGQPINFRQSDRDNNDGIIHLHEKFLLAQTSAIAKNKLVWRWERNAKKLEVQAENLVALPLLREDMVCGVVFLENYNEEDFFAENSLQEVVTFLSYVALTLYHTDTHEELRAYISETTSALLDFQEEIEIKDAALVQKKDEVLQAYEDLKLLSQIGQEIATHLTVEKIIETAYENINKLMDATIFDIGLYNKSQNRLDFLGTIENGKRAAVHHFHLDFDKDRLAVWCFTNREKVIVGDIEKDYYKYLPQYTLPAPSTGKRCKSLIYLPILLEGKVLGVITVQTYIENAYSKYHLNILRNLAVYVGIALENANAYRSISVNNFEIAQQKQVIEKTNESLATQKEQLEQAYTNVRMLGEIGKDITSSLSVFAIIETVYGNINRLMDASVFCIGLYDEQKKMLIFQGGKEEGKTLKEFSINVAEERLASWCFKNNKEIVINDSQAEYNQYVSGIFQPMSGISSDSIIYLPLSDKVGKIIGVITVQSFSKNAYNAYHVNMLRNLAIYTAIALENALLYQNLEEKVVDRTKEVVLQKEQIEKAYQHVKLLSEIGFDVTSSLSTEKIIETVYENVNKIMDAAAFAIGIINEKTAKIEFRGGMEQGEKLPVFYHPLDDDLRFSVWTIRNREVVFINNYHVDYKKYIPKLKPPEQGADPESLIYLPVMVKEKVVGVLTVQSFKPNAYNEYHLDLLRNLSLYIGIALENSEAYAQIDNQKQEIEKTNNKITASINYAQRIQQSILPEPKTIAAALPESFVYFKPKDIVSGDFYWIEEKDDKIFIAAVDCTGHGIPGAFMSLIGNEILSEIVVLQNIVSPDLILKMLHEKIRRSLRQAENDNRDGMDLALCVLDKTTKTVSYAGAMNPLLYIQNNEVQVIRADKNSAGGIQREAERFFTKHDIQLADAPTYFYIFSDGYQDQFGGGRKYGLPRMKEFFASIHTLPMEMQRERLKQEWEDWRGSENQIDDILIIGFKW
jgi:transcriptional regulator with GAF, ATPase, and Fis domain